MTRTRYGRGRLAIAAVLASGLAAGCENAGSDRVLGVDATGVVRGLVYFDLNGSRTPDAADQGMQGVVVRLRARGTLDTTAEGVTDAQGLFRIGNVPVGTYRVLVDTARFGDSLSVVVQDSVHVTIPPADSVQIEAGASFPLVSVAAARGLPAGKKVFLQGIALTAFDNFGDTTVHVADTSGSIRATRVQRATVFAGDSVRVLGVGATRDGQPVLGNASVLVLGLGSLPPVEVVMTAAADTADGARLDAAVVRVVDALVEDSTNVLGDYQLTVNDGSGPLTVVFAQSASLTRTAYVPGVTVDIVGALVPTAAGKWVLKPRRNADIVLK